MFALLSSGLMLWQTQQIVRGGERNYIMATIDPVHVDLQPVRQPAAPVWVCIWRRLMAKTLSSPVKGER
jgi:hypothetical protein